MKKLFSVFTVALLFYSSAIAQIEINTQTTFHDATIGPYGELEDISDDNGGVLYIFVKNNGNQKDSVVSLNITKNNVAASLEGWRAWPYEMQANGSGNNISTITAKSIGGAVVENSPITIEVTTANGFSATQNYFCITPKIRLANVLPSQDMRTLYIYIRNDDAFNTYNINQLLINEKTFVAGTDAALSVVGNDYNIAPGKIAILKLNQNNPFNNLEPLAIRVGAIRNGDNAQVFVGAGIRVVAANFFIGTWHSGGVNSNNEHVRIKNRRLRYNNIHGTPINALMDTAYNEYFLQVIKEANFDNGGNFDASTGAGDVQQNNTKPFIRYWSLDDEPDLNNKPIAEQMEKNRVYWENDLNTPSYVNLAVEKKYSRYGWLPDVVSMDHYAAPDAPNIIPLTWTPVIGRKGEMKEALEYSEYLKFNTEPRRMYSWCQFEAGTWGSSPLEQPRDYALNYQFWAHIAGGAKGIDFFVLQSDDETDIPEQYLEGMKVTRQVSPIRGAVLYGEYTDKVTMNVTPANKATARALVGEEAMLLFVINDNFTFTASGVLWETAIDSVNYNIEFEVPAWITKEQVYQLLPDGSKSTDFAFQNLGNNRYRITPNKQLYKESHVFVIANKDTEKPKTPTGLNIPDKTDDYNYTLSWNEPFDNMGTLGYLLTYNDAVVDTLYAPIYTLDSSNYFFTCAGTWKVYAFDNSWNISTPAELEYFPANPVAGNIATITSPFFDFNIVEGNDTSFTVNATNANDYDWQISTDGINWISIDNSTSYFSGNGTTTLLVNDIPLSINNNFIRAIARSWCSEADTSETFKITVLPNSVSEKNNSLQIQVSPNPTSGIFTIQAENMDKNLTIQVTDIVGKTIYTESFESQQKSFQHYINISKENAGIYILQIRSGNAMQSIRLKKY